MLAHSTLHSLLLQSLSFGMLCALLCIPDLHVGLNWNILLVLYWNVYYVYFVDVLLLRPRERWQSIVMSTSVCLCVFPRAASISPKPKIFSACSLSPCLGLPPAGWRNPKGNGQFLSFLPIKSQNPLFVCINFSLIQESTLSFLGLGLSRYLSFMCCVMHWVRYKRGKVFQKFSLK